ncbi:MAG: methionine aminotransferase [Bacteroidota bacterium]|nr:methionine aminotransferase [Bacteroidota bacterium]
MGALDLSQGFPDFALDPKLIALVYEAMCNGHNQYAPMPGVPALREAIANKVERSYGHRYDPATEITITSGATQAIFTAIAALVHPGDEVIIIDPAYDCYAPAVILFGGKPVHVALDTMMRFDADAVLSAITSRTRMLMINTPHNPGGRILRNEDMIRIGAMLKDTDIILLSDEVYEHIIFDQQQHCSVINYPDLRERSVVIFSFGKTFHGTGWKLGYAMAPAELMSIFRKVHQFNVFSANTPMQHALATYMLDPSTYNCLSSFYQNKRDHFRRELTSSRFRLLPCEGSYFQVVDYSRISEAHDVKFAEQLAREHGVAAIPLSPFFKDPSGDAHLLRFCFAKQEATLNKALEKLCAI